ncbi:potassium voltage-gated channel protein Shaw-like [Saccostrea echinata]|uniref:potassium voltage-gated channel protein Shaw-like n=1 Tax=Saccostrea echinata TaxID=191078 RepID=UPI002A812B29|nr:potassium voltage-gated channel protein Shaw-like [Saccostrea echinata]
MSKSSVTPPTKEITDDEDDDSHDETDEEGDVYDNADDIITLNVGGVRHETRIQTLRKYTRKTTRLSEVADIAEKTGKREFYFDRQPEFFPFILNFYRVGKLHLPLNICGMILKDELKYWMIDDKDIEQCCWVHYITYEETHAMLQMFDRDEKHNRLATKRIKKDASRFDRIRPKLWRFLQDPYSSRGATVYAVVSLLIVILSITVLMVETLPYFGSIYTHSKADRKNFTSEELKDEINIFKNTTPLSVLLIVDNICNLFFFLELVIKFIAAPYKTRFLITPFTLIEFVCLIPYYLAVTLVFAHPNPIEIFDLIRLLIALRVLRIFRIFILMKHFMALKVLMYTLKASTNELFLLLLVVIIGVVIFACLVYYMEIFSDEVSDFKHIPLAFWWALITMTTVGYGDMTPKTGLGYTVGSMCAISGVLVIALSVPAIVQNFTLYYTHAQSRSKLKQRKRKYRLAKWTKITELLKDTTGTSEKPSLFNIVRLAQNSRVRRNSAFIPSTSNGHIHSFRDKRAHSVGGSLSKKDFSRVLQKANANLLNENNSVKNEPETEVKKTRLELPEHKIRRNQVANVTGEQEGSNEKVDIKGRHKNSSSNPTSEGGPTSPKSIRWALPAEQEKPFEKFQSSSRRDEIDSAANDAPSLSIPSPLSTEQECNEADISNSENKLQGRNDTDKKREYHKSESSSEKENKIKNNSDSEYENSSEIDDEILDDAYEEVKYAQRYSLQYQKVDLNVDIQKMSKKRSKSIN